MIPCGLRFCVSILTNFFLLWRCDPTRVMASSFLRFARSHTQRRTTVGRTPLDEWSARRRDLYLTTHDTHNRQISMPPVGFEPMIAAGERPQTYVLDRAATGTGNTDKYKVIYLEFHKYMLKQTGLMRCDYRNRQAKNRVLCFAGGLQKLWRRSCSKTLDKTTGEPYFANNGRNIRV